MLYNVRVNINLTSLEQIEASSGEEATKIARKMFYDGDIMSDISDDGYFDGIDSIYVENEVIKADEN